MNAPDPLASARDLVDRLSARVVGEEIQAGRPEIEAEEMSALLAIALAGLLLREDVEAHDASTYPCLACEAIGAYDAAIARAVAGMGGDA